MDVRTYQSLGLGKPYEEKPRTKRDSGMHNVNGGPTRKEMWQRTLAAEAAAKQKYTLPPCALGTPGGRFVEYRSWTGSRVYPGTQRDWLIWIPDQYDGTAADLIIFNDGNEFLNEQGPVRAAVQMSSLITAGAMRVSLGLFLNPGMRPGHPDCAYDKNDATRVVADDPQRSLEYDTVSETFGRFLLEDILPVVEADFKVTPNPDRRIIVGMSSGAVAAFCAAWFFPERFGKVASFSGSFVNIRGAHNLPWLVRNTLRKPIRIFLLSGHHDMDNDHGSWSLAAQDMAAALAYAGYDYRFVLGTGGHGLVHGGSVLSSVLKWLLDGGTVDFAEELSSSGDLRSRL